MERGGGVREGRRGQGLTSLEFTAVRALNQTVRAKLGGWNVEKLTLHF